jgi:hypothetical protein
VSHKLSVTGVVAAGALLFASVAAVGADYANATVKGARVLENVVSEGAIASLLLSPDGTRLVRIETGQQCTYDLSADPAAVVSCGELARVGRGEEMLWSPDGERLLMPTFSDAILAMRDTDIIILDPSTWTTTNLTDDAFDDYLFGGPAFMDASAQWIDEDTLLFVRYDIPVDGLGSRGQPALVEMDVGGEVTEVFAPMADGRGLLYAMALSHDRQRIAFVIDDPDNNPKLHGIHLFEIGGKAPQRLVGVADVGGLAPYSLSFSADGKFLLALREHPEQNAGTIAMVVNLESGAVSHVTAPDRTVYGAAWSPTGSALAYVAAEPGDGPDDPGGLFIADPPEGPGRLVLAGPYQPPVCCGNHPFLWAANDTIVLRNLDEVDRPVLVELVP